MKEIIEQTNILKERLGLKYLPVGMFYADEKPEKSLTIKTKGQGCIAPFVFAASKGKVAAFDKNSTGYPCSAFYLGFQEWIFPGIEKFLSNGPMIGRECEKFVETPAKAKEYVESLIPNKINEKAVVYKPIEMFKDNEKPEIVVLFANADQMSALVMLLHFNEPDRQDKIVTGFSSSCAAVSTFPLKFAKEGINKAFWGFHDIAARSSYPADITSLAMPFNMYAEMCGILKESFLFTENWQIILNRINK